MAHGGDMTGKPVSHEEMAVGLGFVNAGAMQEWDSIRDLFPASDGHKGQSGHLVDWLLVEVVNLKAMQQRLINRLNARGLLAPSGQPERKPFERT